MDAPCSALLTAAVESSRIAARERRRDHIVVGCIEERHVDVGPDRSPLIESR
jgi:hypothetical protein